MADIKYIIGIDPGTNTGVAVWATEIKKFVEVKTLLIHQALRFVRDYSKYNSIAIAIEDPNKRAWFGNTGREKLQGAGSVKRDYAIWVKYLDELQLPYVSVAPQSVGSVYDNVKIFKAATGYYPSTSKHGRDAARIVEVAYKVKP